MDLLEVVTETPPAIRTLEWLKKNKKAKELLMNHVEDSLLPYMRGKNVTAKMAMDTLDEEYERVDSFRQVELKIQMFDVKLENDSAAEYFAKHGAIVAQLTAAGGEVSEIDRIAEIIKRLPETYDATIDVITANKYKRPNLAETKKAILQRETKLARSTRPKKHYWPHYLCQLLPGHNTKAMLEDEENFEGEEAHL